MSIDRIRCVKLLITSLVFFTSNFSYAGSYFFAGDANGVAHITHPPNYTGNENIATVRICIDPNSPNAQEMEYSVKNNIVVFNQLVPTTDNVKLSGNNNIPTGFYDFESVALHEIGHCLGLGHINASPGTSGSGTEYSAATKGGDGVYDLDDGIDDVIGSSDDIRDDDENLVWFRLSNNDPFTIDTVIDSTTYSRDTANLPGGHNYAANAARQVSTLLGYPKTEAVMQQGVFPDEAQRTLGHDDVSALRYAASGLDERATGGGKTRDNYTIALEYVEDGITNCDITMSITATTALAFCSAGGSGISSTHANITTGTIEFGQGINWFFNAPNTAPVLDPIGDLTLLDGDNLVVNITATDADGDSLAFSASGLPSFATLVDHSDNTATLTVSPAIGEDSLTTVTVTVTDDGASSLTGNEVFDIDVSLDTDGDGLSDDDEINIYGTSPSDPDSDDDGLNDYEEVILYGTLPNDADSDDDFINDFDEVNNGSNPLDDTSWPSFADGDIAPLGAPDGLINAADYLIAQRIVLGEVVATPLELSHGDLYPVGSPDGAINASDLILQLQLIQQ